MVKAETAGSVAQRLREVETGRLRETELKQACMMSDITTIRDHITVLNDEHAKVLDKLEVMSEGITTIKSDLKWAIGIGGALMIMNFTMLVAHLFGISI